MDTELTVQKAIHLRLGQRIGIFLFNWVLCGHHYEQRRHLVGLARHRYRPFSHRLKQGRLHLGRRTVDFVGEYEVGKDRSGIKAELGAIGGLVVNFGARHIGRQQVIHELDAAEVALEVFGQRLDGAGLCKAG